MEHYGFDSTVSPFIKNTNPDDGSIANTGWLNGARYSLWRNRQRSISPRNRGLYCAIRMAIPAMRFYLPQFFGVTPHRTKLWWQNFPSRDCISPEHCGSLIHVLRGAANPPVTDPRDRRRGDGRWPVTTYRIRRRQSSRQAAPNR
jgi:hypothetical protein